MPSIDKIFLDSLQFDYKKYTCFIETGTFLGETIFSVEPYFDKLYTIELSENYYNSAKNRYNGNKINFINGDSSKVFEGLLSNITDKCVFFLDGHYSGGDTACGLVVVPLNEEITHINNLFQNEAIIIIDDFRLFGLDITPGIVGENWSNIKKETLLEILKHRINKVYHLDSFASKGDRLIIYINAK